MTTGVNSANQNNQNSIATSMQSSHHGSMGSSGTPGGQQTPNTPSQQQQAEQQQLMSPANQGSAQQMSMGQFAQPTILGSPLGAPNGATHYQYVVINQQGQAVLQPANMSFPAGMTMPAQTAQQPGQQYIITTGIPQQAKQGAAQQAQMMTSGAPVCLSQSISKSMSQPTYTLTSSGLVSQSGGPQTFMIAHNMGGTPGLQGSNIVTTSSMQPSHIKAEPGKPMQQAQQQQPQQVGAQQPMILPPGMAPSVAYVNQAAPGQAFIQNGQLFVRAPGPQDPTQSQLMFSPQTLQPMQPQTLQPGMTTQQLPPGLTTSMQPMTSVTTAMGANSIVRAPMGYPSSQPPTGKTQISRAPPTLLPATTSTTSSSNRTTTSYMTQPSPKSKQKMSPKMGGMSSKGLNTAQATKSILNNIRNQMAQSNSGSPPILTSAGGSPMPMPGSPSSGPPVLQTSLTLPPPQASNSHAQPPLLQPMMMPTSVPNFVTSGPGGKPMNIAPTMTSSSQNNGGFKSLDNKVPIMPNIKKNSNQMPNSAAPMEPISKSSSEDSNPQQQKKPTQECLTHVIDGHVIHESSQPFPLEDDMKGRARKKSESKNSSQGPNIPTSMTNSLVSRPLGIPPHPTLSTNQQHQQQPPILPSSTAQPQAPPAQHSRPESGSSEKKRGPGRPPGSTKLNIEQQKLLQHNNDIVKVNKDAPANKKAKLDYEQGPPGLSNNLQQSAKPANIKPNEVKTPVSEVKAKYNIDVITNNPLKWSVTQVCDFVKNLPGCSDYVEDFQLQEIDGQALMLLKADHLMSAMAIKLGPALKICNAIEAMREELKQN